MKNNTYHAGANMSFNEYFILHVVSGRTDGRAGGHNNRDILVNVQWVCG
jgi:hypothetical protein